LEPLQRRSPARFAAVALALGLLSALVVSEIVLRQTGQRPWEELDLDAGMPLMHEPDAELGWRNKPGRYVFGDPPTTMTFWPDHTRATAPSPVKASTTIAVLGCSFVQGWALSDAQTFAWKLQASRPAARVLNFGTAAYGTTQSLLALNRYLAEGGRRPDVVVYGFSDFHDGRNVAAAAWLKTLARTASRGHVATPYATLAADGTVEIHPPTTFPAWPFHRELATIALLEDRWAQLAAAKRTAARTATTESLLLELDYAVTQAGGKLLVALLSQLERDGLEPYRKLLAARGIATAECVHPGVWDPGYQVPGSGHPNEAINTYWAQCIGRALADIAPALAGDVAPATP
jgi:hypothetical protein